MRLEVPPAIQLALEWACDWHPDGVKFLLVLPEYRVAPLELASKEVFSVLLSVDFHLEFFDFLQFLLVELVQIVVLLPFRSLGDVWLILSDFTCLTRVLAQLLLNRLLKLPVFIVA